MKVLHVSGGFAAHPLYLQLTRHLRTHCSYQLVFSPVRSAAELARLPANEPGVLEYDYRRVLQPWHRLLFGAKIRRIFSELCRATDPGRFDLVHAHTLYSDGAIALRLKRQFGIPFAVAVRNTDINFFMRLRPDLASVAREVLHEAGRVVCLSPAYREALLGKLRGPLREEVRAKAAVIPNGIGALWLEEWSRPPRSADAPVQLLHVGDLSANKNVEGILRAAAVLHSRRGVRLTLVGGSGAREAALRKRLDGSGLTYVQYLGRIDDARALRDVYRQHDILVMPSFHETFGIVYIEALSQGLPVIHSKGQGIDGFFTPGTVSQAVDPNDIQDIARAAEALTERHETVSPLCMAMAKGFSW